MRNILALNLFIISSLGAAEVGTALKIQVLQGRPVVDQVFINGTGPYRFLLDTGAQSNQIEERLARSLQLKPEFKVEMVTAAGTVMTGGARLPLVQLGGVEAKSQEFLFTSLSGVHELSGKIQGVLGQEFLANFDYLLDFEGKRLVFGEREALGERVSVKILSGRIMALPTSRGPMVLDSGAGEVVFFHGGAAGGTMSLRTASSLVEVSSGESAPIEIQGRRYKVGLAAVAPNAERAEAGLFPAKLFRSVYVCNSGAYIVPLSR